MEATGNHTRALGPFMLLLYAVNKITVQTTASQGLLTAHFNIAHAATCRPEWVSMQSVNTEHNSAVDKPICFIPEKLDLSLSSVDLLLL